VRIVAFLSSIPFLEHVSETQSIHLFLGLPLDLFPHIWCCKLGCWLVMLHSDTVAKPFQSLLFNKFKTWQDSDGISNVSVSHLV
jgi:hypothetical protein